LPLQTYTQTPFFVWNTEDFPLSYSKYHTTWHGSPLHVLTDTHTCASVSPVLIVSNSLSNISPSAGQMYKFQTFKIFALLGCYTALIGS
jgi:hypothetical protein